MINEYQFVVFDKVPFNDLMEINTFYILNKIEWTKIIDNIYGKTIKDGILYRVLSFDRDEFIKCEVSPYQLAAVEYNDLSSLNQQKYINDVQIFTHYEYGKYKLSKIKRLTKK